MQRNVGGTAYTPSSITFNSYRSIGSGSPAAYSGRWIVDTSTDGTNYTSNTNNGTDVSSYSYTPSGSTLKTIRIRFYAAGGATTLLDEEIIPVVVDGAQGNPGTNSITIDLSNDSVSIPTANDGSSGVYTGATTTVKVYSGITDDTANWTLSKTDNNTTSTLSSGTLTVTNLSADSGSVTITATRSNYPTQTAVFSLSKAKTGTAGAAGLNTATVFLYARNNSTTAPTVSTSNSATYTFSNGGITGQPSGWTRLIPDISNGSVVWSIQATAASTAADDLIPNSEWSTPVVVSQVATNTAIIYAYKRASTAPADNPGAITYSFASNTITSPTTLENSWSKTIPSGTDPLYVITAAASSNTPTDNIAANEWSAVVKLVENGTPGNPGNPGNPGLNAAVVRLYARNNSTSTAPTLSTSGSTEYTFSSGGATDTPSGWTITIPAETSSSGSVIWTVQATAASTSTTDTIANTEWSTPVVLTRKGLDSGVGNVVVNSEYKSNINGWSNYNAGAASTYSFEWIGVTSPYLTSYAPLPYGTLHQAWAPVSLPNGTTLGNTQAQATKLYVSPGQKIEASVYVSTHRLTCDLRLYLYNAAGQYINEIIVTGGVSGIYSSNYALGGVSGTQGWGRMWGFWTVPTGAFTGGLAANGDNIVAHVQPGSYAFADSFASQAGVINYDIFYAKWYCGIADPEQTQPREWMTRPEVPTIGLELNATTEVYFTGNLSYTQLSPWPSQQPQNQQSSNIATIPSFYASVDGTLLVTATFNIRAYFTGGTDSVFGTNDITGAISWSGGNTTTGQILAAQSTGPGSTVKNTCTWKLESAVYAGTSYSPILRMTRNNWNGNGWGQVEYTNITLRAELIKR